MQSQHHARVWQWFESVWEGPAEPVTGVDRGAESQQRKEHIERQRHRLHQAVGNLLPRLKQANRVWNQLCAAAQVSQSLLDELVVISADLEAMLASVFAAQNDRKAAVDGLASAVPMLPEDTSMENLVAATAGGRAIWQPPPVSMRQPSAARLTPTGIDAGVLARRLEMASLSLEEVILDQGETIAQGQRALLVGRDDVVVIE